MGFATPVVLLSRIGSICPKSGLEFLEVIISRALSMWGSGRELVYALRYDKAPTIRLSVCTGSYCVGIVGNIFLTMMVNPLLGCGDSSALRRAQGKLLVL